MNDTLQLDSSLHLPGYPCAWSPCRRYRYALWRLWGPGAKPAMFVGLNPSTADETQDDPTIRRCKSFARSWGCDSLIMTNLFAWRATEPREMKAAEDPVGPENDGWLRRLSSLAHIKVAAWGSHGEHLMRASDVDLLVLDGLQCLGTTKGGHPRHPLYLSATAELKPWP